jgi:50S ribosomal subunit-associated GTPase HflX
LKRSLIIGKANAGKTLFCIHFAQYLGVRELHWLMERTDGRTEQKRMSLVEAEKSMSDASMHRTRGLQSIHLEVPRGKGMRHLLLTDTTGLSEGVHPEQSVREAMAQTLQTMVDNSLILHIVDANQASGSHGNLRTVSSTAYPAGWGELDEQIVEFGSGRDGYLMLANKMDLPGAKEGYRQLCKRFSKYRVMPISALHGIGFREVKQHVWRMA